MARRRTKRRGRTRSAVDNLVLDIRTARRLGKLLWRPLVSELWLHHRRVRPLAHR